MRFRLSARRTGPILLACAFLQSGIPHAGHAAPTAGADSGDAAIDEIVVVAGKREQSIRRIAANVTVISQQQLEAQLALSIDDVFRRTPGIAVDSAGTRFGEESINVRGIAGNRVAVLVDGVPLADQFDVGSFSNATRGFLDSGLVQRIEVLHGPASALYGSAAIGGVVAASTPDPGDVAHGSRPAARLRSVWRDADRGIDNTLIVASGEGPVGMLLGGSFRKGEDLPSAAAAERLDRRDSEGRSALLKFVADLPNGNTLTLSGLYQDAQTDSRLASMLGSGRWRSTTALVGDDDSRSRLVSATWAFGTDGGAVHDGILRLYAQDGLTRQRTRDERGAAARPVRIDRYFEFEQSLRGIELNLHRAWLQGPLGHHVTAGVEFRERRTTEFRDGLETGLVDGVATNVILGEVFPLRDFPRSRSRDWGAFVQDAIEAGNLQLIAALRVDRYTLSPLVDAMYAEDFPFATPVSIDESELSPKLGLTWQAREALDLYLQYSHGFRAPPYEDANVGLDVPAFNYRAIPNPQLRSERSDGLDVGARWRGVELSLEAAWFRTDYDDFIESRVRVGTDPASGRTLFQAQNVERARIEGFELRGAWRPGGRLRDWALDLALFAADGENRDSGAPLESVGPAQAVIGVDWQAPNGNTALRLQLRAAAGWDERDERRVDLFEPPGHGLLDLYVSHRVSERLTLRAAVHDLADRVTWSWSTARGLADGDPLVAHLARPGRHASLGFNFNWQ